MSAAPPPDDRPHDAATSSAGEDAVAAWAADADRTTTPASDGRALFLGGDPRRWGVFAVGLLMLGLGVALVITADLGVNSWQLLEVGLVGTTGLPFSVVIAAESVFALALGWIWLGERPGPATWVIAALAGVLIDVYRAVLPTPTTGVEQAVMLALGTLVLGTALGLYLATDLGPSAQDAVFAGLMRAKGMRPLVAKALVDVVTGVLGVALGAALGVGTIVLTFALPPIVERALTLGHRLAGTPPLSG